MSTTIYRRPIVTPLNHPEFIRAAYQAAAKDPAHPGKEG